MSESWKLGGNTGTDANTQFIGTTDEQALVVRTCGKERLRISQEGHVGIGTGSPEKELDVHGTVKILGPPGRQAPPGQAPSDEALDVRGTVKIGDRPREGGPPLTPKREVPARLEISGAGNEPLLLQSTKGSGGNAVGLQFQTYATVGGKVQPTALVQAVDDGSFSSDLVVWTKQPGKEDNPQVERLRIYSGGGALVAGRLTAQGPGDPLLVANHTGTSGNPALWLEQDGAPKACMWWDRAKSRLNLGTPANNAMVSLQDDGKLGIGTTTPAAPLTVQGSGDPLLLVNHTGTSGNPALWLEQDGAAKAYMWWDQAKSRLNLGMPANNAMLSLQNDGKLGIGTTTPTAPLTVQGSGDPLLALNHTGTAGNPALWFEQDGAAKAFIWWEGAANRLNVGIAGRNPALSVQGNGDVEVAGDLLLSGADCAEEFDVAVGETAEPGMVMVLDGEGALRPGTKAYDRRVAGIVSGAGEFRPALRLDRQTDREGRMPLALAGKVYCKVDARYAPIDAGDLLTTSPTRGHAMKASDPAQAFGAVLGKALRPLEQGTGVIPILVALQ